MPAHIHAALMAEYAKDALETETPWERWQFQFPHSDMWHDASAELAFSPKINYRRKPVALCQVEGRDVFPGDKLWHECEGWVTATKQGCSSNHVCVDETLQMLITRLSWTEPTRTKTVYQWAFRTRVGWASGTYYCATETELRNHANLDFNTNVIRLDYTALEVPA